MADTLPGVQLWEPALNVLSSGDGSSVAFPQVPDRSTITASSWLTDHHFSWKSGHNVIYTYGYSTWQAYANYDINLLDPNTPSSAWQKFYANSFAILNGSTRLPHQTDTAQWDSFLVTNGLSGPVKGVQDWLSGHLTNIQQLRDSIATNESTIQGKAADVMWQIFDHFHYGMKSVADQLGQALTYLNDAAGLLRAYHDALVAAWNKWIGGQSGGSFDTGKGYMIPDSPQLISPVGALNAMARILTFNQHHRHRDRGLRLPVPDNFAGNSDLASWNMWVEIEEGAKNVWVAKMKQLDDPSITTAFDAMVAKYRLATSSLQLTAPTFGPIDGGVDPNDTKSGTGGGNNDNLDGLINKLTNPPPDGGGNSNLNNLPDNLNTTPPPDGGGGGGGPNLLATPPPGTGDTGGSLTIPPPVGGGGPTDLSTNPPDTGALTNPPDTGGGGILPPTVGPVPSGDITAPPGSGAGSGADGYLVPDGGGGYAFQPSSDFVTNPVPAGAIPGRMITGTGGTKTFQPSSIGETDTAPTDGTPGYLVPDGQGGYAFTPASAFPNASDVPSGAIPGYQVSDGNGATHFVPSATGDQLGDLPGLSPTPPPGLPYTPIATVSRDTPLPAVSEGYMVDSAGNHLSAPPPVAGSYADGSTVDLSTGGQAGDGGVSPGGAAAANGANNVPLYPPMAGMGGMGMGGNQQTQDRERTTWLAEDERVWGTDPDVAPAVLGRGKRKRKATDEEEFDYAPFGGKRPGTATGKPQRPADQDRQRPGRTGGTTGV